MKHEEGKKHLEGEIETESEQDREKREQKAEEKDFSEQTGDWWVFEVADKKERQRLLFEGTWKMEGRPSQGRQGS